MARWRARCRQVLQPGPQLRQWASTHLIYVMHTQSRGERGGGIGTRNLRCAPCRELRPALGTLGAPAPLPNPARCFDCRIDPPTPARTVIWLLAAIIVGGRATRGSRCRIYLVHFVRHKKWQQPGCALGRVVQRTVYLYS